MWSVPEQAEGGRERREVSWFLHLGGYATSWLLCWGPWESHRSLCRAARFFSRNSALRNTNSALSEGPALFGPQSLLSGCSDRTAWGLWLRRLSPSAWPLGISMPPASAGTSQRRKAVTAGQGHWWPILPLLFSSVLEVLASAIRKGNFKKLGGKGRSNTVFIQRQHDTLYRKSEGLLKKLLELII